MILCTVKVVSHRYCNTVQGSVSFNCTTVWNAKAYYKEKKHTLILKGQIKFLTFENLQRTFSCQLLSAVPFRKRIFNSSLEEVEGQEGSLA